MSIGKIAATFKILAVLTAIFACGPAMAQNGGTVTLNAFAIGLGPSVSGFKSVICTGFAVGTGSGAAPTCRVIASADIPASVALTGTPTAPTAAVDTNTTQLATTAFVLAQAASATPLIDGSAAVGTSTRYARGDHVHPTDTTRAPLASPTFTGVPAAPTAAVDTNTTQLATTAYVIGQAASASPLADAAAAVGTSTRFARADHVHPFPAMTGDVTSTLGAVATTIAASAVTNAKRANMTANTVSGNATGGAAAPADVAPALARSSSLLNVDSFTGHGDSIYTILASDRTVGTNAAFTASRTWTLPAANAVNAGQEIIVADFQGTVTGVNTLVVSRAGADTINGGTTATISAANGGLLLRSDGVSKWTAQSFTAGTGVTSITAGTGLSGGTITTSGTIAVSLTSAANSLGADVNLNNTANYFDGPSTSQGTSGTWLAVGQVTLVDSSNATFDCKLWDGTTVIASARIASTATNWVHVALSGVLASPAANIKMSCKDTINTTGKILFNASGNSKDSTLTAVRIN